MMPQAQSPKKPLEKPFAAKNSRLLACVQHLCQNLGHALDAAALQAAHHRPPGGESDSPDRATAALLRAVLDAAPQAGLHAAFGARRLRQIRPALLPAVLVAPSGQSYVLYAIQGQSCTVFDPALGPQPTEVPCHAVFGADRNPRCHLLSLKPDIGQVAGDLPRAHWFRTALMAHRWAYMQVALAAVVVNILAITVSLFSLVVYDRVLPAAAQDSLLALSAGVAIAVVFDFVVKSLRAGFIDDAGQKADLQIGARLFDHMMDTQLSQRLGSVGQTAALMREIEHLRDFFTSATLVALVDLPFVVMFLGMIYVLAGGLVVIPGLAVVLVLALGFAVQPRLARLSDRLQTEGQSKQAVLVETLSGMETIKALAGMGRMRRRWDQAIQRQSHFAMKSRALTQWVIHLTSFCQQSAQILVIIFGAVLVMRGQATVGVLTASLILTSRALGPLGVISQTLTRAHQAQSAYRSLDRLMQAKTETQAGKPWLSRPDLGGGLRFEAVRFTYPGQTSAALDQLNLQIMPGERVAIVGAVGSGKSTIARLALGLYAPDSGVVYADGVDIRQINPADLRRNIGVVLQDNWLVSGSLRDNIAFGDHAYGDDEVLRAARIAGVEGFAAKHPDGYAMTIHEGGAGLSGGQRQMVALARALITRPKCLILDEPTSAMDLENETAFINRLRAALHRETLIVMTHRQSLLNLVDRVIVLEGGKISAAGSRAPTQPQLRAQVQMVPARGAHLDRTAGR